MKDVTAPVGTPQYGQMVSEGPGHGPSYILTVTPAGAVMEPLHSASPLDENGQEIAGHQRHRTPGSHGRLHAAGRG